MTTVARAISLETPLARSAVSGCFKQVIGFTGSVDSLHNETSAFERRSCSQIGLGAAHGIDYPLHPESVATKRIASQ